MRLAERGFPGPVPSPLPFPEALGWQAALPTWLPKPGWFGWPLWGCGDRVRGAVPKGSLRAAPSETGSPDRVAVCFSVHNTSRA